MIQKKKAELYTKAYQTLQNDERVADIGYPEKKKDYEFTCKIGPANVTYKIKNNRDMIVLRSEIPTNGVDDKEVIPFAKNIVEGSGGIQSNVYDGRLVFVFSTPFAGMDDESAARLVTEKTDIFFHFLFDKMDQIIDFLHLAKEGNAPHYEMKEKPKKKDLPPIEEKMPEPELKQPEPQLEPDPQPAPEENHLIRKKHDPIDSLFDDEPDEKPVPEKPEPQPEPPRSIKVEKAPEEPVRRERPATSVSAPNDDYIRARLKDLNTYERMLKEREETLEKEKAEWENSSDSERLAKRLADVESLENSFFEKQREFEDFRTAELESIEKRVSSAEEIESKVDGLLAKLKKEKDALNRQAGELSMKTNLIKAKEDDLVKRETVKNEEIAKKENALSERESRLRKMEILTKDIENQNRQQDILRKKIDRLQAELERKDVLLRLQEEPLCISDDAMDSYEEETNKKLLTENTNLLAEIEDLKAKNADIITELNEAYKARDSFESELNKAREDRGSFERAVYEKDDELRNVQLKLERVLAKKAEGTNDDGYELARLKEHGRMLKEEADSLKKQLEDAENDVREKDMEIEDLKKELSERPEETPENKTNLIDIEELKGAGYDLEEVVGERNGIYQAETAGGTLYIDAENDMAILQKDLKKGDIYGRDVKKWNEQDTTAAYLLYSRRITCKKAIKVSAIEEIGVMVDRLSKFK